MATSAQEVFTGGSLPPSVRTVNPPSRDVGDRRRRPARQPSGVRAAATSASNRRGVRARPRGATARRGGSRASGSSIASSVPSSAQADGRVAGVGQHRLVVVARRRPPPRRAAAPARVPGTVRTGCAAVDAGRRASARRGRPGRAGAARACRRPATAMTCMPRQMPSTGSPARRDAAASASSSASRSGRGSCTRGCARGAVPARAPTSAPPARMSAVQALEHRAAPGPRRRPAAAGRAARWLRPARRAGRSRAAAAPLGWSTQSPREARST